MPGIGPRSAERVAFHLLRSPTAEAELLARAVMDLKAKVRHCRQCFNLTEQDPCGVCTDSQRNSSQIWVVEQPKDVMALESTGLVQGVYHVLMGHISPLEGVDPGDLTIDQLVSRVKAGGVEEVILATNPTMEGDGTALHVTNLLSGLGARVSRLARGLAVGSQLEYANPGMLEAAIQGRR